MLTIRGRRKVATIVLEEGCPIARAAQRLCVSRPTVRTWVRREDAEGEAGLEDRRATTQRRATGSHPSGEGAILDRRDVTLGGASGRLDAG
jgi:transposase